MLSVELYWWYNPICINNMYGINKVILNLNLSSGGGGGGRYCMTRGGGCCMAKGWGYCMVRGEECTAWLGGGGTVWLGRDTAWLGGGGGEGGATLWLGVGYCMAWGGGGGYCVTFLLRIFWKIFFYDYRSKIAQLDKYIWDIYTNNESIKVARIFFCGIINEVRRRREGIEGGGGGCWPFLGGMGPIFFRKWFSSDFEHIWADLRRILNILSVHFWKCVKIECFWASE